MAGLVASGVDPNKTVLFQQSEVPEHTGIKCWGLLNGGCYYVTSELAWLFGGLTNVATLQRMIQYREKAKT